MGRGRGAGLVGLLWSVLGLALVLSVADLSRGRDSVLRAWWTGLRVTRHESAGAVFEHLRENAGAMRGR
jgi:hypothetical protein